MHDVLLKNSESIKSIVTGLANPYFEGMVKQIHPPELQLNKANNTDTEAPFLDLHMDLFLLKFMINAMTLILI